MKKAISFITSALLVAALFTGCGTKTSEEGGTAASKEKDDNITVTTREDSSGTRGAFIELFGIEEKDADGNKVDQTIATADVNNSTGIMLTAIAQNESAIGYVSMGSLNDTVKALAIDGAEATTDNIKNGSYKVARPFIIATKDSISPAAQDFIDYILSSEGQAVVQEHGYIPLDTSSSYSGSGSAEKVTIEGSSSVTPLMEKLKEAYIKVNPDAKIEIQQSDSSAGISSAASGVCEIGMSSRELKDSELSQGLTPTVIATDGIAVIVNKANEISQLTSAQVKSIYTGEITKWSEVK